MRKTVSAKDWEIMFRGKYLYQCWNTVKDEIRRMSEKCIPKYRAGRMAGKCKPMWTNKKTITAIQKKRDNLHALYRNTRDDKDYVQYRRASNRIKAEVRKAVRDFEKLIATEVKANPKGFFKYARSKLKTNPIISDLEQRDGTMATGAAAKAALGLTGALVWCE